MMLLVMTILTGVAYPLAVTGIAKTAFPAKADGSLIERNGKVVGSELIGQQFDDPRYFWGRHSATAPFPYNAAASSGSNLGPLNPDLKKSVEKRVKHLRETNPENIRPIPIDLVTASASGLDPDISPAAAGWQVTRVAKARGIPMQSVENILGKYTKKRQFGLLGEHRVNVLELNMALDLAR